MSELKSNFLRETLRPYICCAPPRAACLQVIAHAPDFRKAVQKMTRALGEFNIRGIKTNITFLENVMRHPEFLAVSGARGGCRNRGSCGGEGMWGGPRGGGASGAMGSCGRRGKGRGGGRARDRVAGGTVGAGFIMLVSSPGLSMLSYQAWLLPDAVTALLAQGEATTFFIEKNARDLFVFESHGSLRSSKLLMYMAEQVRRRAISWRDGGAEGRGLLPVQGYPNLQVKLCSV